MKKYAIKRQDEVMALFDTELEAFNAFTVIQELMLSEHVYIGEYVIEERSI